MIDLLDEKDGVEEVIAALARTRVEGHANVDVIARLADYSLCDIIRTVCDSVFHLIYRGEGFYLVR